MINLPLKIIKLLESNISPGETAAGVCLGMFLGFTPLNGPMAALLAVFFFIFRLNRVSTVLTMPLFKTAYLLGVSGVLEKVGGYLLIDAQGLAGFWGVFTGLPVIAYLDINNTLVAGGLAGSAILSVPVYFAAKRVAAWLKKGYEVKVKASRFAGAVNALKRVAFLGRKAPSGKPRKRVNILGVAALALAIVIIHYGVGMAISPMAGSFIIESINRAGRAKISAERVNIWPLTLSFSMKGLKVFNPKKPAERIVKADEISFRMSPAALLSKRVVFSSISLIGAEIDLEGRPDGSFNVQDLGAGDKPEARPVWKDVVEKRDTFGKFYRFIRDRFAKKMLEKRRAERKAKNAANAVTALPGGRRVRFKSGPGAYLFEIKRISLDNGYVKIKPADEETVEIERADIALGKITFDPDKGAETGLFSVKGDVARNKSPAGRIEILFSQTEEAAEFNMDFEDIDLDAIRFVYKDSLPVNIEKGYLTLSSRTRIKGDAVNSRNSFSLAKHNLAPKDGSKIAFGLVPAGAVVEALNRIDPVNLKFDIGGTAERLEFSGFQESLLALIRPYISNIIREKAAKEGMDALGGLLRRGIK